MNSPDYKGHNGLTWSRPSTSSKLVVKLDSLRCKLILGVTLVRGPNQTFQYTSGRQPCTTWGTFNNTNLKASCKGLRSKKLWDRYTLICKRKIYFSDKRGLLCLVRFNAVHRIKSYDPQLESLTVNSFKFQTCVRSS